MKKAASVNSYGKQVCIVIPVYKVSPSISEILSYQQCLSVLSEYDILIAAPYQMQTNRYDELSFGRVKIERFENRYFENITGYNQLVMSKVFYKRFSCYKYMLLYQLDAFVFKDDLQYWCSRNYDYVAAPWMDTDLVRRYWASNSRVGNWLAGLGVNPNVVGNGGFSLRKIKKFLFVIKVFDRKIKIWDSNEDIFWSLYVPYYFPFFKIPPKLKALRFAFETQPSQCFELANYALPMGCHAWEKYNPTFWKQFIPIL